MPRAGTGKTQLAVIAALNKLSNQSVLELVASIYGVDMRIESENRPLVPRDVPSKYQNIRRAVQKLSELKQVQRSNRLSQMGEYCWRLTPTATLIRNNKNRPPPKRGGKLRLAGTRE